MIVQYFASIDGIFRAGSTSADIDALFSLTNEDVRYIHRNYDADFERTEWRAAFDRNLQRGGYQEAPTYCSVITNAISGNGFFAVEYAYGDVVDGSCLPRDEDRKLIVFEIRNGKLSMVEELW